MCLWNSRVDILAGHEKNEEEKKKKGPEKCEGLEEEEEGEEQTTLQVTWWTPRWPVSYYIHRRRRRRRRRRWIVCEIHPPPSLPIINRERKQSGGTGWVIPPHSLQLYYTPPSLFLFLELWRDIMRFVMLEWASAKKKTFFFRRGEKMEINFYIPSYVTCRLFFPPQLLAYTNKSISTMATIVH